MKGIHWAAQPESKSFEKAKKGSVRYRRIKWGIFISGISVFAQLYDFQALLSNVTKNFNVSPSISSYTVSSGTFGMALGLLIYAFIADNFLRKKIMAFSLLATSFLTLVMPLIGNFELLIALNFLKGVCVSGVSAVTLAYLSEEISPKNIGVAISFYLAGNTFGGMFGRVFTGLIGGYWGWETAILSVGGLGLILALLFIRILPKSQFFNPERQSASFKIRQLRLKIGKLNLLGLYILAFLLMGSFVSVYNYFGFKLEAPPYHLPHYLISAIFLMYAFGIVGNLLAGYLSDRFSTKYTLLWALIGTIVGIALFFTKSLFLLLLGLTLFTLAFFSAHTLASRLVTQFSKTGKTMATCLYWLFYYVGSSVIGTSSGIFVNEGAWNLFFITLLILSTLALFAGIYSTRKL